MSRLCELTGIRPLTGNTVSHANNKTKMRQLPNLKYKKYFIPELDKNVSLRLSTRAIRTIDKLGGVSKAVFKASEKKISGRLLKLKKQLEKKKGV
ncbi:MAG: 50S ribosomal protein L28 [Deltaproteobacteria bacterium]|nr:50S ribosomal protein L28 [Deltaproteobacteria bacterium]